MLLIRVMVVPTFPEFVMPPPRSVLLPLTVLLVRVMVPVFKMPPPLPVTKRVPLVLLPLTDAVGKSHRASVDDAASRLLLAALSLTVLLVRVNGATAVARCRHRQLR